MILNSEMFSQDKKLPFFLAVFFYYSEPESVEPMDL